MDPLWNLYRFDHYRFVQLRPALRCASDAATFASLAEGPASEAIVEALIEGDVDVVGARQDFLIALCCIGEPVPCPKRFPRILQRMRTDVRTEEGAEILSDAIAGGRNLDNWLLPAGKLAGILTPDETSTVYQAYSTADALGRLGRLKRHQSVRKGGLLSGIVTFFRRLFDWGLAGDEVYRLLGQLLEEAVACGQGIAVVTV